MATSGSLTEADVFFELFVPLLLESKAAAMEQLHATVELRLRSTPPRIWNIRGGPRPWMSRGACPKEPDVVIVFAQDFVSAIVQGRAPAIDDAIAKGQIGVHGRIDALNALGMTLSDAQSVLTTMLDR